MQTILATTTPDKDAASVLGRCLTSAFSTLRRTARQHQYRKELQHLAFAAPRLVAELGMSVEEAEEQARAPIWQSPHLPPLRHF